MTFFKVIERAKSGIAALFGTPKPAAEPDYDHRWDGMTLEQVLPIINAMLPAHEQMTVNGLKKRQSGPDNGGTKATPLQSWAMSWVLKDTRAGAAYDLRNGMHIFAEKYFMAVIEDNKKARILAQPGWWWLRNFWAVCLGASLIACVAMLVVPALDLAAARASGGFLTQMKQVYEDKHRLEREIDNWGPAIENLKEQNEKIDEMTHKKDGK